jgi:hypothetical protein
MPRLRATLLRKMPIFRAILGTHAGKSVSMELDASEAQMLRDLEERLL